MQISIFDTKVVLDPEREMGILKKGFVIGMEESIRMRRQKNLGIINEEVRREIKRETVIRCYQEGLEISIIAEGTCLSETKVKRIIEEYSK